MKRYILMILCCVATMMTYAQYADCTSISDTAVTISRWGEFYTPVPGELECWTVDLNVEGAVKITYNVDLDLFNAIDQVIIYELDANDHAKLIGNFCAITESGVLISASNRFKVEYWGFTGNLTNLYEGFQLHFEKATQEHVVNNDYYVLGKLGVGTTHPKAKLHVNGSIYGGETLGAIKLQSDGGYVTIGTGRVDRKKQMQFTTDLEKYVFNKPIFTDTGVLGSSTNSLQFIVNDSVRMAINGGKVGVGVENPQEALHVNGAIRGNGTNGAVTLKGDSGYVTIGATSQAMEFVTDKSQFVFNKPIYNQSGIYDLRNSNLLFNINDTTRMTILQNNGNVGIGTTNPSYNLDVNGTIRANEIIVNTSGADFVFADDYRLRPLSEVKAFVTENNHLPEIQSAQEMQENGVSMNELQIQLLQKIEELTLYLIQQDEIIQKLRQEVELLKK